MSAYIVYLLFKDDIRAIHSEKMAAFIRDQRADPVTLGARVHSAIGRMADDLALNGRSIPTSQQIIEIVQVAQTAG